MAPKIQSMSAAQIRIRESRVDKIFNLVNYSILTIFLLVVLYPLIYVVSASFSDGAAVISGRVVLWPVDFSLLAYEKIFQYESIWTGYANSLFYAVVGTSVNIVLTFFAAYALARQDLYGRKVLMGLFVFTMFFNGGLIPTYLLVKDLGMLNTRAAMIIPRPYPYGTSSLPSPTFGLPYPKNCWKQPVWTDATTSNISSGFCCPCLHRLSRY